MIKGCLRGIGCSVGIALVVLGAWLTRDAWLPMVRGETASAPAIWQSVDSTAYVKAQGQTRQLARDKGPVFINLSPSELGALLLYQEGGAFARVVRGAEAGSEGDALVVRGRVMPSAFAGLDGVGAVASKLSGPQRITLKGVPSVRSPGRGVLRVDQLKVGDIIIPKALYPALIARLTGDSQRDDESAGTVSFALPRHIGDIRVSGGRVTLYKTTQ